MDLVGETIYNALLTDSRRQSDANIASRRGESIQTR